MTSLLKRKHLPVSLSNGSPSSSSSPLSSSSLVNHSEFTTPGEPIDTTTSTPFTDALTAEFAKNTSESVYEIKEENSNGHAEHNPKRRPQVETSFFPESNFHNIGAVTTDKLTILADYANLRRSLLVCLNNELEQYLGFTFQKLEIPLPPHIRTQPVAIQNDASRITNMSDSGAYQNALREINYKLVMYHSNSEDTVHNSKKYIEYVRTALMRDDYTKIYTDIYEMVVSFIKPIYIKVFPMRKWEQ